MLDFSGARLIKLNLSLNLDSDVGKILRTVLSHYDFRLQLTVIIDINNLNFDISNLGRLVRLPAQLMRNFVVEINPRLVMSFSIPLVPIPDAFG